MPITITEALSELNLLSKKIEKKQQTVLSNLVRYDHVKDPFESAGGTQQVMTSECRAISDLQKRYVTIRSKIAEANTKNRIVIGQKDMTINEWLNWKREISEKEKTFVNKVHSSIKGLLDQSATKPNVIKDDQGQMKIVNVIPNLDYGTFIKASEDIQDVIEKLDGQLSLKNATILIDI